MAIPTLKARRKFKERLVFGFAIKPLRLFCELCGKYVPSDQDWECGYCHFKNLRTKLYSFLRKCQKCKRAPKAFKCPHCEKPNFLDSTHDMTHPATFLRDEFRFSEEEMKKAEEDLKKEEEDLKNFEKRKVKLERDKEIYKLREDLAKIRKSDVFKKKLSTLKEIEAALSESEAKILGAKMVVAARLAAVINEFGENSQQVKDFQDFAKIFLLDYT